ncbi:MAG: NADH-quinone oxidoreductase subunit M [Candidatus Thermoplasmatota archaeon]|nr:NADH-quinone oxidoreductase subunit M [Candidatus Thermoplasmatota archaeon]MCL5681359.1 NADH-quinone oxidoreductase subunit M [Candidatus Thermoplasmatota archaeon]
MIFPFNLLLLLLTVYFIASVAIRKWAPRLITVLSSLTLLAFVVLNGMNRSFNYSTVYIISLSFQLNFVSSVLLILVSVIGIFISLRFKSSPGFHILTQSLIFSLTGLFLTRDFIIFYIFWEMVLIPSFFMIGMWGTKNKDYAAMKFFIYTHVGSVFMLLGIFTMYFQEGGGTFNMNFLIGGIGSLGITYQAFVLFGFLFAFLIKLPSVPFHSWLPDAYVESPSEGTVLISSLLSKMGAFGLLILFIPMYVNSSFSSSPVLPEVLLGLGIFSLIYSSLVALYQKDMKMMMSYASVGHMSFITIAVGGFLYLISTGSSNVLIEKLLFYGAVFQLISHGIIIAMIFALVDTTEKTTGTRIINSMGGIARKVPGLSFLLLLAFLASVAIPGFSGFVGEITILLGAYAVLKYYLIFVLIGVVLTASYHIFALQRSIFGPYNEYLGDIRTEKSELYATVFPLAIVFLLGIFPGLLFGFFNLGNLPFMGVVP